MVFGSLFLPNINHYIAHKLSSFKTVSFPWVPSPLPWLSWSGLKTNKIIISRHVIFNESTFSSSKHESQNTSTYRFLDFINTPSPIFKSILESHLATPIMTVGHYYLSLTELTSLVLCDFLSKNTVQMKHLLVTKRECLRMGKHKMLESVLMIHSVQWSCPLQSESSSNR